MTDATLRQNVLELSDEGRLALMIELWESLDAAEPSPVTEAEKRLIEGRLSEHRADPHDTVPLEQAEARLREAGR